MMKVQRISLQPQPSESVFNNKWNHAEDISIPEAGVFQGDTTRADQEIESIGAEFIEEQEVVNSSGQTALEGDSVDSPTVKIDPLDETNGLGTVGGPHVIESEPDDSCPRISNTETHNDGLQEPKPLEAAEIEAPEILETKDVLSSPAPLTISRIDQRASSPQAELGEAGEMRCGIVDIPVGQETPVELSHDIALSKIISTDDNSSDHEVSTSDMPHNLETSKTLVIAPDTNNVSDVL